ncbi:MAG: hypothetical protein M1118_14125 [Chloroflexi bacterium]|nr:hypothetical protein [Chloroflexota bacterium]
MGEHRPERVVEPDDYVSSRPEQVAGLRVVPVDNPAFTGGMRRNPSEELLISRRLPVGEMPIQPIQLNVPHTEESGKTASKGGLT